MRVVDSMIVVRGFNGPNQRTLLLVCGLSSWRKKGETDFQDSDYCHASVLLSRQKKEQCRVRAAGGGVVVMEVGLAA